MKFKDFKEKINSLDVSDDMEVLVEASNSCDCYHNMVKDVCIDTGYQNDKKEYVWICG